MDASADSQLVEDDVFLFTDFLESDLQLPHSYTQITEDINSSLRCLQDHQALGTKRHYESFNSSPELFPQRHSPKKQKTLQEEESNSPGSVSESSRQADQLFEDSRVPPDFGSGLQLSQDLPTKHKYPNGATRIGEGIFRDVTPIPQGNPSDSAWKGDRQLGSPIHFGNSHHTTPDILPSHDLFAEYIYQQEETAFKEDTVSDDVDSAWNNAFGITRQGDQQLSYSTFVGEKQEAAPAGSGPDHYTEHKYWPEETVDWDEVNKCLSNLFSQTEQVQEQVHDWLDVVNETFSQSDESSTIVVDTSGGSPSNSESPKRKRRNSTPANLPGQPAISFGTPYLQLHTTIEPSSQTQVPTNSTMAPTYRNQNRRQNRTGVIDHDIYEGIPVRQWRREFVTVAPPPTQDNTTSQNDIWAVELPHGMPKDSHLLPQHSQDLLRAARSGRIYKRPAPPEEEEADPEAILGDKPEKKEEDPKDKGFTAKAWKPAPRHLDLTDNDYLAKKRKNLVPKKPLAPPVIPTVTKTTVKRIDAAGNEYVQDVVVPHGQKVEGEVIAQTVIPDPSAVVDPFPVQPTPPKRKGGTSKKKLKGPGRGRKKKQQAAPTSVPQPAPVDGVSQPTTTEGAIGPDGVKIEADASATPTHNEDTEMGDGSMAASDDDDGDEGEDGDDGEDDEGSDAQASPSKRPRTSSPPPGSLPTMTSIPDLAQPDTVMGGTEIPRPARILTEREKSEGKSGSPLKTVALTASTLPSPHVSPTFAPDSASFSAPTHQSLAVPNAELASLNEVMQLETTESAPPTLPPPPPEPTQVEIEAAVEMRQEEEEEEEMLLDIQDNANNAQIGGEEPVIPAPEPEVVPEPVLTEVLLPAPVKAEDVPVVDESVPEPPVETVEPIEAVVLTETAESAEPVEVAAASPAKLTEDVPVIEATEAAGIAEEKKFEEPAPEVDDDDDYPDLLGGLERSLEKKETDTAPATGS